MPLRTSLWMKVIVALLTVTGVAAAYYLCFAIWMTAYIPPEDPTNAQWITRFYILLGVTLVVAALWTVSVIWLVRHRRENTG